MDVSQAIADRRSIRRFREEPVPTAVVAELLAAAFAGPIGTRQESRHFVVLTGEAKAQLVDGVLEPGLARLEAALDECQARETVRLTRRLVPMLRQAPVVIIACMELLDREESLALPTVAAAVENLLLAAHERGLGTCWTTGATYLAEDIREHLGLADRQIVALVALGRPAEAPGPRTRPVCAEWRGFADAPVTTCAPRPARPSLPDWARDAGETAGATILIADDSPSARAEMREALTAAGYQVQETDSLAGVFEALQNAPPSLIIIDALFSTDVCAEDLPRQFRELVGTYVPLLFTARAYHLEDKAGALAAGADGLLGKPVRWPELLGQVRSLLRAKRLYDVLAKTTRDLQDLMHQRERLTSMIVHDLRSPLAGITGTMQYVLADERTQLEEGSRDLLEMSLESGQTLLGMVNDLLDISKMSEVGLTLDHRAVDVAEVAEAALRQVGRLAVERAIDLAGEVPRGLPAVSGDRPKLQRVLVNLLGNAIKFTPSGGHVRLAARTEDSMVLIAVSDTGLGIPEKDRERIFDMFAQVEDGGPERRQGTGLGLTFCRMVVEALGGRITVKSEEGRGSTFTVALPVADGS